MASEESWLFQHDGQTWGPFSTLEIKNLAAAGVVRPQTLIWLAERDIGQAVQASAALDFSRLEKLALPAPDWLADVHDEPGPEAPAWSPGSSPDWLQDLQVETGPKAVVWDKEPVPDWLEDVARLQGLEPPKAKQPPPTAPAITPKAPEVTPLPEPPGIRPPPSQQPALAFPIQEAATPLAADQAQQALCPPPMASLARAEPQAAAFPSTVPVPEVGKSQPIVSRPRKTVIAMMGFDPLTGEVVDMARFKKWTKDQVQKAREARQAAKSSQEIFEEGRRAVEGWVDADANKDVVMKGDMTLILQQPTLKACLEAYRSHGPEMVGKLCKHLEFMVENRRRYYDARGHGKA